MALQSDEDKGTRAPSQRYIPYSLPYSPLTHPLLTPYSPLTHPLLIECVGQQTLYPRNRSMHASM